MDATNKDVTGFTTPAFTLKEERKKEAKKSSRYFRKTEVPADGVEAMFVGAGEKVFMHTFFGKGRPSKICIGKKSGCEECAKGEPVSVKYRYNIVVRSTTEAQILELGTKNEMPRFNRALESGAINPTTNYVRLFFNRTNDEGDLLEGMSFKNGGAITKDDMQRIKAVKLQDLSK